MDSRHVPGAAGGRHALIVANDEYADPELRRLAAPAHDATALAGALGDPSVGGFAVQVLRNQTAQETRIAIEDFFAERGPEDLLLLHFSCHGLKNAAGELYLAVADTRPTRLASTGVGADFVNRQMADSRAQRIALFLDCCYGGAFPRGMVVRAAGEAHVRDAFAEQERVGGGRGRVVVTASSAMEYAFEGSRLAAGAEASPSVFTGAVVDGLTTGEADRDGDGWVALTELVGYVSDKVRRVTPHQTPQMWTFGSQGELLIARSRVRRITPTPLPPELVEAMDSPLAASRFGVVDDLRDRLRESDLGQAYAALQALRRMSEDDSRKVSEAARRGVADAVPKTSVELLDLGAVAPGDSVEGSFTIEGPPIALTAVAECPAPWLKVEQQASVVHVTALPTEVGESTVDVLVSGPTGERAVAVHVHVAAAESEPAPTLQGWAPVSGTVLRGAVVEPHLHRASAPMLPMGPASSTAALPGGWTKPSPAVSSVSTQPGRTRPIWIWRLVAGLIPVVSCGFLTWAVLVFYAAWRRSWMLGLAAAGYLLLSVLFLIVIPPQQSAEFGVRDGVGMVLLLLTTFGGAMHAALIDPRWRPRALGNSDQPLGL